jgi:hypothetical protein
VNFKHITHNQTKKGADAMQMTEQEFKDLMAHFYFLGDKIDPVYKRETDKVIENIEKEYKQYVKKWF